MNKEEILELSHKELIELFDTSSIEVSFDEIREGDLIWSIREDCFLYIESINNSMEPSMKISNSYRASCLRHEYLKNTFGRWFLVNNLRYLRCTLFDPKSEDPSRKDYCHSCQNDKLYWHAMSAKCSECNSIILGG